MSADTIIAACAVVIAAASLFLAIRLGIESRRHERLATTPILRVDRCVAYPGELRLAFSNQGIGPAILDRYRIRIPSGEDFESTPDNWTRILTELGCPGAPYVASSLHAGDTYAPGESCVLFQMGPFEQESLHLAIGKMLLELEPRLEYHSVFGEQFETTEDGVHRVPTPAA